MDLRTAENNEWYMVLHQSHLKLNKLLYTCPNLYGSAFSQKVHELFSDYVPLSCCLSSNMPTNKISSLFGGDKETWNIRHSIISVFSNSTLLTRGVFCWRILFWSKSSSWPRIMVVRRKEQVNELKRTGIFLVTVRTSSFGIKGSDCNCWKDAGYLWKQYLAS